MQSKRNSHKEALTNNIVGALIGWLVVAYILMPIGTIYNPETVATISTIIFFITSYIRSYIIRRIFNKFI